MYTFPLKWNQDLGPGFRDKIPLLSEFFPPSKEFGERKFIVVVFMEKIIFYMNYENSVLHGSLHTSLHFSFHMRSTTDEQSVAWRNWCQGVEARLGWLCKIHKDNLIFITQGSVFLEVFWFFVLFCFFTYFSAWLIASKFKVPKTSPTWPTKLTLCSLCPQNVIFTLDQGLLKWLSW